MSKNIQVIVDSIKALEFNHAEGLCWLELKIDPNSLDLYKLLGLCLLSQKKYYGAIEAYLKCLPSRKKDFDIINNLGYAYRCIVDIDNANKYIEMADEILPGSYPVLVNKIHIAFALRNFNEAKRLLEICFKNFNDEIDPEIVMRAQSLWIEVLFALNKIEEAIKTIQLFQKNIFSPKFFYDTANNLPSAIRDEDLINAEQICLKKELDFYQLSTTYFGLGKYYEYKKDYLRAFGFYLNGNQLKADVLRFKPYARQNEVKNIIKIFTKDFINKTYQHFGPDYLKRGEGLIFIVGMPRTGTTLLESILCSSDIIQTAGEQDYLNNLGQKIIDNNNPPSFEDLDKIGKEYLRMINAFNPENKFKFIVDKMPSNIYNVGLIKSCLPSAKIICLDRDPNDNAWSVFTQLYLENIPYSSNLFNLGLESSNVGALINWWSYQFTKKDFKVIKYEDLVSLSEKIGQDLFNEIGLNEDYSSEKRKNFYSRTASKTQVQQDVYKTSVSRSKKYEGLLGAFEKSYKNQQEFWINYFKSL
jgi:tetratricopeptide (TPR) repeat protein|tara:strand:+ start:3424 stop:5010 length:1587 start_codon:yes stop_codon:yes gene_type:complete